MEISFIVHSKLEKKKKEKKKLCASFEDIYLA